MEDGVDTREVIKNYALLKTQHKKEVNKFNKTITKLETENKKLTKSNNRLLK